MDDLFEAVDAGEHLGADDGMPLDLLVLGRLQCRGLVEDPVGDADLADVVKCRCEAQQPEFVLLPAEATRDRDCVLGDLA